MEEEIEDLEELSPGHYGIREGKTKKEKEQEKQQENIPAAEEYNRRQREIAQDMKTWNPKPGDRVLVDKDWVPGSGVLPVLLTNGRIMGFNLDGTINVQISGWGGNYYPVQRDAVKQDV